MTRAPQYFRQQNFLNDAARGLESPAPAKIDSEFDALQQTANQTRNRLEAIVNADGSLKPNQPVNASVTEILPYQEHQALGGTPETVPFTVSIDADVNSIILFKNGLLVDTAEYTYDDDGVSVNTILGDLVAIRFYDVQDSVLTVLAEPTGSELIGYDDPDSYGPQLPITGTPTTVSEGLTLALGNLNNIGNDLYPLSQWVKADGSRELSGDWFTGGNYRIKGHPASAENGDVVVHEQFVMLNNAISGASEGYVATDGSSTMTGALDMGSNPINNVEDGQNAQDAVAYGQLDDYLKADGTTVATGQIDFDTFGAKTSYVPVDGEDIANKDYVDDAVLGAATPSSLIASSLLCLAVNTTFTDDAGDVVYGPAFFSVTSNGSGVAGVGYPNNGNIRLTLQDNARGWEGCLYKIVETDTELVFYFSTNYLDNVTAIPDTVTITKTGSYTTVISVSDSGSSAGLEVIDNGASFTIRATATSPDSTISEVRASLNIQGWGA